MDIRNALLTKLHNSSFNELKGIIDEGIASREETILPGLGVLFEKYYNSLDTDTKQQFLQNISSLL